MKLMSDKIIKLINEMNPDFISLEDCQFQNNYATFQQLSQLAGVIFAILFEKNIDFMIVPSTAWKSAAGVKGRKRIEQKSSAIQIVQDKFGLKVKEDEADAILIGDYTIKNINYKENKRNGK